MEIHFRTTEQRRAAKMRSLNGWFRVNITVSSLPYITLVPSFTAWGPSPVAAWGPYLRDDRCHSSGRDEKMTAASDDGQL